MILTDLQYQLSPKYASSSSNDLQENNHQSVSWHLFFIRCVIYPLLISKLVSKIHRNAADKTNLKWALQVNLDMTDSIGPGKLVRHMQNLSYTYDEHLICIGLGPSISSVICKNLSYSGPSYPSSPVSIYFKSICPQAKLLPGGSPKGSQTDKHTDTVMYLQVEIEETLLILA